MLIRKFCDCVCSSELEHLPSIWEVVDSIARTEIYTYRYTCILINSHMHTQTQRHMHTHGDMHIHIQTHIDTQIHVHIHMHAQICTYSHTQRKAYKHT